MGYSFSVIGTSITYTVEYEPGYDQYRVIIRTGSIGETEGTETLVNETYSNITATFTDTFSGLSYNTKYTINCRAVSSSDWMGATEFTTGSDPSARPSDWAWTTNIVSGGSIPFSSGGYFIPLTATEWIGFCDRINKFRIYKNLSEYSFTSVSKGTTMTASIVNEARTAISSIPGCGTLPSAASSGGVITATFFNGLKDALNAVP